LAELEGRLAPTGRFTKAAVVGLGGIGKTQIALEVAYRMKDKSPRCSVFWVPALSLDTVRKAFVEIGRQLHVPGLEEPTTDVFGVVQQRLSHDSAGRWLLIVDNADDAEMWFEPLGGSAASVRLFDYLPRSEQASILITTRSRKVAMRMASNDVVVIPDMDESTSAQMLRKALITPVPADFDARAPELLKRLTYLPLAIVQAAAYINANSVLVADYLSLLGQSDDVVVDLLSEHFEDEGRYAEAKNPIATTWLISFEHIRRTDPLAAKYLSFMACLEPKSIPQSLLPQAKSPKKMLDAVGTLSAYSFVTRRPDGKSYDMHRLVHLASRNWLAKERRLEHWKRNVLGRLACVFPNEDPQNRELWRNYSPHARYVLEQSAMGMHDKYYRRLSVRYGRSLDEDGRYAEAESLFLRVVTSYSEVLGPENPRTLSSMSKLASIYWHQGRSREAEALEVQVLEARKRVLGEEHPDTLTSKGKFATTYMHQGRWTEAEALQVQVLEARKRVLGKEHPWTLTSMASLASTYWHQGRLTEAEALYVQVLQARKRLLGEEHPDTWVGMGNLATTYWHQGRWTEAEALDVQVLEARKRVLGEEHPATLSSMAHLATTYRKQGRCTEAEALHVQVLEARRRVLGEEHPDTLTSMADLATTYRK
jgi:tetratricopeptide (TPR) repeat protein